MRRRLMVAIVAVTTAAVVLFALPLAVSLRRTYRDEELLRLQRDTVAATREIDVTTAPGDQVELPRSSDVLGVYDRAGRRIAGRGPARADGLVRSTLDDGRPAAAERGAVLVVAVPLLARERVAGAVRAGRSASEASARAHRAWLALAALAAGIIGLAALAAFLLARRLAAPLERVAAAARRLGEGDFAARAPRAGVPEVDAVAGALDATAQRLDDLVSRERTFSADASHQLRTPLAALRLELETMELEARAPDALRAALAQVDRLQATIDTLLSVARDAPRAERRADLAAVLRELEARWHGPLAAQGRPLHMVTGGDRAIARAAPEVVDQVLEVLVANAARHGAGAVTVTVREVNGSPAVDVADEGPGLPGDPEAAFARGAGSGAGHGIGLPLARSLAHADGGRLVVTRAGPEPVFTLLLSPFRN